MALLFLCPFLVMKHHTSFFSDQSPQGNKHSAEEKSSHKLWTGQNATSTSKKMLDLVFPVLTLKSYDGTLVDSKKSPNQNHLVRLKWGKI